LFLLTAGFAIAGIPANYLRVHSVTKAALLACSLLAPIVWAGIAGVIALSVIRRQSRPADYGLSLRRGGLASLAAIALIHIYLALSGKFVVTANGNFVWSAWGAFMEELLFRAIAIDKLILMLDGIKRKAFWAILGSAALWSLPHLPTKSPAQVLGGIFLGGLIFGYIYYKSRSILLPAWIHSVANAGYSGGVLVVAVYCVIGVADWFIGSRSTRTSRAVATPICD
jgi:membrane protease YdiL (CAAX protease family)